MERERVRMTKETTMHQFKQAAVWNSKLDWQEPTAPGMGQGGKGKQGGKAMTTARKGGLSGTLRHEVPPPPLIIATPILHNPVGGVLHLERAIVMQREVAIRSRPKQEWHLCGCGVVTRRDGRDTVVDT